MKNSIKFLVANSLISLSAFSVIADDGSNWGNHMGFGDGYIGNHMGIMGGGWMMIIWILLLIVAIVIVGKLLVNNKQYPAPRNSAQEILAERYAKGEITDEEFQNMKQQLD